MKTNILCITLLIMVSLGNIYGQRSKNPVEDYFLQNLGIEYYYLTTDNYENVYVSGFFTDTLSIKNYILYTRGLLDIFLAKFDNQGKMLWIKQAGGFDMDMCKTIYTDIYNNVYISGAFKGAAHFEDTVLYSQKTYNFFTAKYSNTGNLVWVRMNN